jgi:NADPH:quinone reductase-like Zn-dependent oxidoreductase
VLAPRGIAVIVGGPSDDPWLGPLTLALEAAVLSPLVDQRFEMFMSNMNQPDLAVLHDLMAKGTLRSVIDRRYPLAESAAAIAYLELGRARGKVVVTVE